MDSDASYDDSQQPDRVPSAPVARPSTQAQMSLIPHLARKLNPTSTGKKLTSGNTEKRWIQRFKRDELPNQQRSYKLSVRQQPVRARLSSFKEANETSDRRPIDPPIIVEVQSFEKETAEFKASNSFFVTATLVSAQSSSTASRFNSPNPTLRSPSVPASHTRTPASICATSPVGELDPAYINDLTDGPTRISTLNPNFITEPTSPTLTPITHVPTLDPATHPHTASQVKQIKPTDPYPVVKTATGSNATAGDWVMSTEMLRDYNGDEGSFCVFSKLYVRVPGKFRLRFILYEKTGTTVHKVSSTVTDPFEVFSPKKYPGMMASTELTRYFASQGMKLKLRAGVTRNAASSVTTELDGSTREEDRAPARGIGGTGARGTRQTATRAGKAKAKETERAPELESNSAQKSGPWKGRGRKRLADSSLKGPIIKARSNDKPSPADSRSIPRLGPEESMLDMESDSKSEIFGKYRNPSIESTGEAGGLSERVSGGIETEPIEFGTDDPSLPAVQSSTLMASSSSDLLQPPRSHLPSIRELALSTFDWKSPPRAHLPTSGLTGSSSRGVTDPLNQHISHLGGNISQTSLDAHERSSVEAYSGIGTSSTAMGMSTRSSAYNYSSFKPSTLTSTPSIPSPSYSGSPSTNLSYSTTQITRSLPFTAFPYQYHPNHTSFQGQDQNQSQNQNQNQNQNQSTRHLMQRPLEPHRPYHHTSHPPSYLADHTLYANHPSSNCFLNTTNHEHLQTSPYSQPQHPIPTQAFRSEPPNEHEPELDNPRTQELASQHHHMYSYTTGFYPEQTLPGAQQYSLHPQQYQHQPPPQHTHAQQNWNSSGPVSDLYEWPVQNNAEPLFRVPKSNVGPGQGLSPDDKRPPFRHNSTGNSELDVVERQGEEDRKGRY